ncbi:MAG: putative MAP kinase kinase family domain protein [Streblomastix strix]|uniref:non-specific serine/threonine protein kinase n=1 Tax=Streblomastix strix TaxID=222440 RepID=A0A5J4VAN8_9EUKA|nr:MAG: putative MAP kinase kinase family domain protein [Streblomastix strix]
MICTCVSILNIFQRVWELIGQITRALDHLHSRGIMHRDLKPANIFMNEDGSVRLGDFGLVRDMNNSEYATYAGTKAYMAPEGHTQRKLDLPSDIYSLGIICYQLLTGRYPFESASEQELISKIIDGKHEQLPDWVPKEMRELIERMLNNDPFKRPTTKQIMDVDMIRMYLHIQEQKEKAIEEKEQMNEENKRLKAELENRRQQVEQRQQHQIEQTQQKQTPVSVPKAAPVQQVAPVAKQQATPVTKQQAIQSAKPSVGPVTNTPNITQGFQCKQQGNKIVHFQGNNSPCTVTYNPVISSGIVRFEGFFEKTNEYRIIGVADASVVYAANNGPGEQYRGKAVRFSGSEGLLHIPSDAYGRFTKYSNFQRVACEVNMDSTPRKAYFFVEGTEQPRCVYNIPNAIRFMVLIRPLL